jgi:leucyl aminopeptidase
MDFELKTLDLDGACADKCDALVVLVPESFKPGRSVLSRLVAAALKAGDLEAKAGKQLQLYKPDGVAATRVLLAGCGDGSAKSTRTAVQGAIGALKSAAPKRLTLCFAGPANGPAVRAAVQAVADASYVYTTTKPKADARKLRQVLVAVSDAPAVRDAFAHGAAAVKGIETAKEWGNRPPNHATPTHLADAAKALAKAPGLSCEVLGPKEVAKLGMGSFMAVAQGSAEPLRFIVLRYNGGARSEAPVVLVGKGITFDTCGAASVLGVFSALAHLRPAVNVVGLIPSCENMPDGRAVKPGDVVTSMSGQTIEILNTDAEGRLILCDALTYAERFKPRAVVDIATLTGACVIALGAVRSGLFASDDALANALLAAGEQALDPCWRMPLDDEYADGLKSNFADMGNVAGRAGGAITAAKFLQKFTAKMPWAHLDIAGTAWKSGAAKGSTGRPVALLLDYIASQAGAPKPVRAARKAK